MTRASFAALALMLWTACDGGGSTPANASSPEKADKVSTAAPSEVASASEEPAATNPPAVADLSQALRFRDPPWFRPTLFGDKGKDVGFARSEADEAGLFKSHITFELAEGTTVDDCASMAMDAMKATVEMERTDQGERTQLEGSTDRYRATVVCGEAKGTMRAYVAYEWTS